MLMSRSSCHFCKTRACMRTKTCCHGNDYFTETFTYATASLIPRPFHLSVANDKCWGEKTWERGFVTTEHSYGSVVCLCLYKVRYLWCCTCTSISTPAFGHHQADNAISLRNRKIMNKKQTASSPAYATKCLVANATGRIL